MADAGILGGLLKRIGNYNGMESFEDRLILQKTIYLLQAFDLYIGYRFSWYIHGPYCTDLTKDGYSLGGIDENIQSTIFSDQKDEEKFSKFLEFMADNKNNTKWLEIIASIHFLNSMHPSLNKKQILDIVVNKQPYFQLKECEDAWNYLKKWDLISE